MPQNAWLIPVLPLLSFVLHVFIGRRLGERSAYLGIITVGASFVLALAGLAGVLGGETARVSAPWLQIGERTIAMGYRVGPLEAVMLVMVSLVSWMVLIFSRGYMHGDARYNRFFAIVNLFVAAMLTLVIADNFLLFFVGWELMGLCSYLLISHWFENLDNARAAMKAFMVTRLGDVGLMLGIWLVFINVGSFRFEDIWSHVDAGKMGVGLATFVALMLFTGAVGKSAQMPLHIWLPDAMAGPTPISALIHAATMVAAGVYLVARAYPIFQAAPLAMDTVAVIGAATGLMAALIATVQTDIKKTLAYSTISQLGLMMLSMGVGGLTAGIFHLLSHAFFKALLFLGSGSVIHAAETQDMHRMGGLFKKLPVTGTTFVIGTLALSGIPPLAGFFSKDEILLEAFHANPVLFWLGVGTSLLTAYYMWRAVTLTFFGRPRDHHVFEHAHESPAVMTGPLVVLAVPAVLFGFLGAPFLGHPLQHFIAGGELHMPEPSGFVQGAAITVGVAGILGAWLIYGKGVLDRGAAIRVVRPLYVLFKQKFFFDHLAMGIVYVTRGVSAVVGAFDKYIVDGLVNLVAWLVLQLGNASRRLAVGSVQAYAMVMFAAIVVGMFFYVLKG